MIRLNTCITHNVKTTGDVTFLMVFKDYYERAANREWQGVTSVFGHDGQQVLIKHGSFYIWVHLCRLQLCKKKGEEKTAKITSIADKKSLQCHPESIEDDKNTASNIRKIGETNKPWETFETDIPSEPLDY